MFSNVSDLDVSRLIVSEYYQTLTHALESDVVIVGGGPSGLVAGYTLAGQGKRVVIMEKRLAPGGGVWGGGKGCNYVVVEPDAAPILAEVGIAGAERAGYLVVPSLLLASALIKRALESGVTLLNLCAVEDVYLDDQRAVAGVVVNDTAYQMTNLHVDPLTFRSKLVMDSTGHEAIVLNCLAARGLLNIKGEDAMNAPSGERGVLEGTREVYPGLIVTGMACSQFFGTPRMGPIFGGMLLSGKRAADVALARL